MKTYLINTRTTTKSHKYYIDSDYIQPKYIKANNVNELLEQYQEQVKENNYTIITKNGLKTKNAMYIDTKEGKTIQTGYVINASTDCYNDEQRKDVKIQLELWVDIDEVVNPFEEG